jgi:hypothetical protein
MKTGQEASSGSNTRKAELLQKLQSENLKEGEYLRDLKANGTITSKLVLNKQGMRVQAELKKPKAGSNGGLSSEW